MIEQLAQIDRRLFLAINSRHSVVADVLMSNLSELWIWVPLYLFFLYVIQRRYQWRGLLISLPVIAALVFVTDSGSVHLFKETVQRLRPCHEPELQGLVHLVDNHCGGRYGFVSSHAANHFGIAAFMIGLLRGSPGWAKWALLGWAVVISFSRIYLGQHYPGDVLVGGLYGFIIGWIFFLIFRAIIARTASIP